jgi:hypothetical protein|tara:strand:- start:21280 stop:21540 length:261 start_codon:yes stop_codon:yes gene_type:complete
MKETCLFFEHALLLVIYWPRRLNRFGIIFLKELKMLLLVILATIVAVLFAYSLFKDTGKNTKYARKGANAIAQASSIDTGEVAEVN